MDTKGLIHNKTKQEAPNFIICSFEDISCSDQKYLGKKSFPFYINSIQNSNDVY